MGRGYMIIRFFPNRSLLLKGSHGGSKRGYTETHTKRAAVSVANRLGVAKALRKFVGFYHQSQNLSLRFGEAKIFSLEKQSTFPLLGIFPIVLGWFWFAPRKPMFCRLIFPSDSKESSKESFKRIM